MAIDLFRVQHGLEIENDVSGKTSDFLNGDGIPGGDAGPEDAAPVGSFYLQTDTETDGLQVYWKHTNVNNSSADWKQSADKGYVDAVAAGLSWREPVVVMDDTLYANSTAFPVGGTIDGVVLAAGDRVLFTNVTDATSENIFIWSGAAWAEDVNAESDGDAVLIQDGTNAEEQWVYDGIKWVQFGSAAGAEELAYLRAFMGKTGPGAELPTYTSTGIVTQSGTLEAAVGELDAAGGNRTYTNDNVVTDGESFTSSIDSLDTALGNRTYTDDNVVTDGESTTASIDALDQAIGSISTQTSEFSGTNVIASATVTVDTIPLAQATQIKWMIQVRETATPANRRGSEVHALNDGATLVDTTRYAILKLGSPIAGFKVDADISGTDMRLRLTSTNNVDYVVKRISFTSF